MKLNATGEGFMGGIDPPLVAYQQIANGQSNLKLYNADNQTRPALPAGVNTPDWEWEPSISGDWLLFGRQTNNAQYVIPASLDPATPGQVVLDQGPVSGTRVRSTVTLPFGLDAPGRRATLCAVTSRR